MQFVLNNSRGFFQNNMYTDSETQVIDLKMPKHLSWGDRVPAQSGETLHHHPSWLNSLLVFMVRDSLLRVFIWPLRHESRWRVKSFQSALATELWVKLMYAVGRREPRAEKKLIESDTLVLSNTADNHSARWRSLRDSPQTPLERLVYSAATFPPKHCLSLLPPLIRTLTLSSLGFFYNLRNFCYTYLKYVYTFKWMKGFPALLGNARCSVSKCVVWELNISFVNHSDFSFMIEKHCMLKMSHFILPLLSVFWEMLSLVSMHTSQVGSVWFIQPLGP